MPTVTRQTEPPPGWDALVQAQGTFYHDRRWLVESTRCFGYRLHVLTTARDDTLTGGLALAEVPGLLGRGRLVSFPFSFIAGPLAADPETRTVLLDAARALAGELHVRRLEIKQLGADASALDGFVRSNRYTTYRVPTHGGETAVWKRLHVTSTQQRIRKGQKAGVVVVDGHSESDWLAMAQLEERVQQGHGVPAPPRRFFLRTLPALQQAGLVDLYLARVPDGRFAAGFVMYKGPREWVYALSASDPSFVRDFRPTHVLLWAGLQRATAAGVTLDLGRTAPEQTSLAEFKLRWGAEPVPLSYDYWPSAGGLTEARRDRTTLALVSRLWRALPAPVARLGSVLYRYLG